MVYAKSLLVAAALTATVSVNAAGHHGGRPSHHMDHAPGYQGQRFRGGPHRQGGPPHRQVQRIAREELVELDDRSLLDQVPNINHGPVMFTHPRFPRDADEAELDAREPMIPAHPWDQGRFPVDHNRHHHAMPPHPHGRPMFIARDVDHDIEARGGKKSGKHRHGKHGHGKKRPHGHGQGRPKQHRPHGPRPHKRPQGRPHNNGPKVPKTPQAPPHPTQQIPAPGAPTGPDPVDSPNPVEVPPMAPGAPGSTGGAPPPASQPTQDLKTRAIVDEEDIQVRAVKKPNGSQGRGKKHPQPHGRPSPHGRPNPHGRPRPHGRPNPHGRPSPHAPFPPRPHMPVIGRPKGPKGPNGPKKPTIFPPKLPTPPVVQPGIPGPVVDAPPDTQITLPTAPAEPGAPAGAPQTLKTRIVSPPWYFREAGRPIGGPYRPPRPETRFRRDYELDELD